jgi:hypothetical protein
MLYPSNLCIIILPLNLLLQIVLHPRWGSAVYPATLFTKAPLRPLLDAIKEAEAELQGTGLSQPRPDSAIRVQGWGLEPYPSIQEAEAEPQGTGLSQP